MPELITEPSAAGMAVGSLGRFLVFAAIALFLGSAAVWAFRAKEGRSRLGGWLFTLGAAAVAATMGCLIYLLLTKQYQFDYVSGTTENRMPTMYRLSAAWAKQEGSFLLWALMSAVVAMFAAPKTGLYRRWFSVVAGIALSAMLAITAYESPFKLLDFSELTEEQRLFALNDGVGLNPQLENYWMVIHPWVIFIGFGSLLSLFAWATSVAFSKDWDSWVQSFRPFAIFSMTMLGVGLVMGGLWAYETLGWGGFWAWDPVENVSLVPFIACAVLVHALYVRAHRNRWGRPALVLALLPFLWFVFGTYLTRSGALVNVSVHSFAEMNQGAHGVLLGLVVATLAFTGVVWGVIWARGKALADVNSKEAGHRQEGLTIGMSVLYLVGIMAAIGMSLPFFSHLFGFKVPMLGVVEGDSNISAVSEDVYNRVAVFAFIPAMFLMGLTPFLGWTKTSSKRTQQLANAFFLSALLFSLLVFFLLRNGLTDVVVRNEGNVEIQRMSKWLLFVLFASTWVTIFSISANLIRILERVRSGAWGIGAYVTHAGVALLLLGLVVSKAFEKTDRDFVTSVKQASLVIGSSRRYLARLLDAPTAEDVHRIAQHDNRFPFLLQASEGPPKRLEPVLYFSEKHGNWVMRPDIYRTVLYDLYYVIGKPVLEIDTGIQLKPGEEKASNGMLIRYLEPTQQGEPGAVGTRFGARVRVTFSDGEFIEAEPAIEITERGTRQRSAAIASDMVIALDSLDAATKTASFSLLPSEPVYPTQLFYKPLTILVWIGAGMMTVGGFAAMRRKRNPGHPAE
ncbi:hypothetical protein FCG40_12405 [Fimbriimonadia bacterium ATM]|nr:MAG: hypothetical protein EDM73_11500 [Armatimonadota bacterium]MBC6970525.1 hypothetical protein [Armatimonadota bacterium]MCE7900836.1 hypothetical protein [Armatimonadetes bacterium ATM1]MDL1929776.1 hypothetical protein [Fimbriimonadia bacterium ATM]RIJ95528.1 MAG: hypothetical protein DCC45_09980 [Armatimonadota bacterium]